MAISLLHFVSAVMAGFVALAGMAVSGYAYFPTGDIFEVRPSRIRIGTPDEFNGTEPLWLNFPLSEPLPKVVPQESLVLVESDPLVLVFPARNWGNSDMSIYEVGQTKFDGFQIALDHYIFEHRGSGTLDSFSPPSEQIVLLGTLQAGDYTFNVRRWFLNYEDRLGFNEAEVEPWSVPAGDGLYSVPDRYVTDELFTFTVLHVGVPEPATWTMLLIAALVFCSRRPATRWVAANDSNPRE
jgi:hypothetical protein